MLNGDNSWDLNRYRSKCIVVARPISAGRAKRWWLRRRRQSQSVGTRGHTRLPPRAHAARTPRTASHTGKQTVMPLQHTTYLVLHPTLPQTCPPNPVLVLEHVARKINYILIYLKCQLQVWIVNKNFQCLVFNDLFL